MMTPAQWLEENLDGHLIVDDVEVRKDYLAKVGKPPPQWPNHSKKEIEQSIDERGLGGNVDGPDDMRFSVGFEIATHMARALADGYRPTKVGRGSVFRQCVAALRGEDPNK